VEASVVDLRYKMKDVLKALDRNEEVVVLYRGKEKGRIVPSKTKSGAKKVESHPFFGMNAKAEQAVAEEMQTLRGGRY
jgi:hypothetical protein